MYILFFSVYTEMQYFEAIRTMAEYNMNALIENAKRSEGYMDNEMVRTAYELNRKVNNIHTKQINIHMFIIIDIL